MSPLAARRSRRLAARWQEWQPFTLRSVQPRLVGCCWLPSLPLPAGFAYVWSQVLHLLRFQQMAPVLFQDCWQPQRRIRNKYRKVPSRTEGLFEGTTLVRKGCFAMTSGAEGHATWGNLPYIITQLRVIARKVLNRVMVHEVLHPASRGPLHVSHLARQVGIRHD